MENCHHGPRKLQMGVAYRNLSVYGQGNEIDYQKTFLNYPLMYLEMLLSLIRRKPKKQTNILRDFEGLVESGEMLVVLGRPGSGCTTLLKTLAGQNNGICVDKNAKLNYQGIPPSKIFSKFRGRCTYQAEFDVHFPLLTMRQTLQFAANARAPRCTGSLTSITRKNYTNAVVEATSEALGLSKTLDTKVGNDFIQGVSGGERKRASIAEILTGNSSFQCWDNSTRGLDSSNALQFVRTLSTLCKENGSVAIVSLYQSSETNYMMFDKVVLLYEGRQVFFGPIGNAKDYFISLGFTCPERSTTADFLTSLTTPTGRIVQKEHENRVPRTPEQFALAWKQSLERRLLMDQINKYEERYTSSGEYGEHISMIQKSQRSWFQPSGSPYMIPLPTQIRLCLGRSFQRLWNDLSVIKSALIGNTIISIILGSMFYNLSDETDSFFAPGALIFFLALLNSTMGGREGVALWDQRPIVEKQFRYAFYQPVAEAVASVISELPNKVLLTICFNTPMYFLTNLRRTPEAFFTFSLFAFSILLTGSMVHRAIGAMSRTLSESIAPGAVLGLLNIIYTGFEIPIPYMHPWLRWFKYINPTAYTFESLMVNEFSGRQFKCSTFVPDGPGYQNVAPLERMCATVGATPGSDFVNGDAYIASSFYYYATDKWRNLAWIILIGIFYGTVYLLATEYISLSKSRGEVLLFRRGNKPRVHIPQDEEAIVEKNTPHGREKGSTHPEDIAPEPASHVATFIWENLSYDVEVKGGNKRILDDVEGWIKPGTLTALMGSSGAGKTTLLNVLAERATLGLISGEKLIDVQYQDEGFARKVGYAQQQDLHMPTATVRESMRFSAILRQSSRYSKEEKIAYAENVIDLLDMSQFADSIVGIPGEGLNIEQRKRLTIGVELAAKPELLLFLDEPTSGLDSDTAWAICSLIRKLANNGQAIMCTIHQPSGPLLQMFDNLLFLAEGRSLYFGEIGANYSTMIDYFERNGARHCNDWENPAEWLLEVTGEKNNIDWPKIWKHSEELRRIQEQFVHMKRRLSSSVDNPPKRTGWHGKYASTPLQQLGIVTKRNLQNDWRTPSYLWAKVLSTFGMVFINGFSFWNSQNSLQGVQNSIFSLFMLFTVFATQVQLIMARFVENRTLYESRERPSRTYSWVVFVLSNIISELPSQTIIAVLAYLVWYYPLGLFHDAVATHQLSSRGGLTFLLIWSFMIFCSTMSQMVVTIMPNTATGINIANLLYMLSLLFAGVLISPHALPRFWIFMYRVTPVEYFVSGLVSTGLGGVSIDCAANELVKMAAPDNQTCGSYLATYISSNGANLLNPNSSSCDICPLKDTDALLERFGISFDERWWHWGITIVYSAINVMLALLLYWAMRVPKGATKARA